MEERIEGHKQLGIWGEAICCRAALPDSWCMACLWLLCWPPVVGCLQRAPLSLCRLLVLQSRGHRVAVIERRRLQGRNQGRGQQQQRDRQAGRPAGTCAVNRGMAAAIACRDLSPQQLLRLLARLPTFDSSISWIVLLPSIHTCRVEHRAQRAGAPGAVRPAESARGGQLRGQPVQPRQVSRCSCECGRESGLLSFMRS